MIDLKRKTFCIREYPLFIYIYIYIFNDSKMRICAQSVSVFSAVIKKSFSVWFSVPICC